MTDPVLLTATELCRHFDAAGVTLRALACAVLGCTPVDLDGNIIRWPATPEMRMRHLVRQLVRSPHWPDQPPVPGLNIMSTVVAEKAVHAAIFNHGGRGAAMLMNAAQVEEVFKATTEFVKGKLDEPIEALLRNAPAADGLFAGYTGPGPDELEASLTRSVEACARKPLVRIADEPFEEHRLLVWRVTFECLADAGERVTDAHAVLFDNQARQAGYVRLRHVKFSAGTQARDLAYILDAYDELGLEMGAALRKACEQGALDETCLAAGLALVQLQEAEVRHDLRGQGLGLRLARRALSVSLRGLRPQPVQLVMAVKPMQFDYPLTGMPADLLLEALDAAAAVQAHVEAQRPQDVVSSLRGSPVLYLGVDGRATGTHFEQLTLLAEEHAHCTQEPK